MLFTLVTTLIVHSIKKVDETYWCSSSTAYQETKTDRILRIFTFDDKNLFYLPIISTLHIFEDQSDQGVTDLVIKPFGIFQSSRMVNLSQKNAKFFQTPFYFYLFFWTLHQINSETNPPTPIINVLCKYLKQFLGTSFGAPTLLISCNIE